MNYLKVPDSDIQLTDGSVVMLARFPGTKWVVHYGWYDYSGRRAMGWYFSSIPAQTVIPATNQDLKLIVLIDNGSSTDEPGVVGPPAPPVVPGPCNPGSVPPFQPENGGLFPLPDSTCPSPTAYFSKNDKYLLDTSWISLPSIKYRDALSTLIKIPDGKIVKVNNVDGKTRYYSWDAVDQRWNEKFFENDAEELLVNYYTKEEIDILLGVLRGDIAELETDVNSSISTIRSNLEEEISARRAADDAEATARRAADDALQATVNDLSAEVSSFSFNFDSIIERLDALEAAVFDIQDIVAESNNTVLVSKNGTLKDSGISIGDDSIDEPTVYANPKTLATEKAVAKLVDENVVQWSSF